MTMPRRACLVALAAFPLHAQSALKIEPESENVVASRLVGRWQIDVELTRRLGGRAEAAEIEFAKDDTVVARIPERMATRLKDHKLFLAGNANLGGKQYPFVLTVMRGNPHLVWFRERGGEPMGDAESCNLMLARGAQSEQDLLFVGGDFNNQPFAAYGRAKTAAAKQAPDVAVRLVVTDMERLLIAKQYAELIRTYAEPAALKRMESDHGGIDKMAEKFADRAPRLQQLLEKVRGKDPVFNDDRTEATFTAEGEDRPLKLRLVEGRWYLVN